MEVAHALLDKTEIDSNVELKIILEWYGKGWNIEYTNKMADN